tara:strand:+ start:784 stop:897 length:114 start_codon:yes stop_codon:yes gene_type:complete
MDTKEELHEKQQKDDEKELIIQNLRNQLIQLQKQISE